MSRIVTDSRVTVQLDPGLSTLLRTSAEVTSRTGAPDPQAVAAVRTSGLTATAVPTQYGGAGGDATTVNRVVYDVARVNPSLAIMLFQHFAVCARIAEWGSPPQRAALLPALARGDLLAASAWNESGIGSTKHHLSSIGRRVRGDRWVLTGDKSFTTSAAVADIYLVLVRTGTGVLRATTLYGADGLSFFLVGRDNPGLVADLGLDLIGMRGSATGFVSLRDCVASDADRLGPEGGAGEIIADVRQSGHTLGAVSAGIARAALELLAEHLRRRNQLRAPGFRHRLAGLANRVEAAEAVMERAGARSSPNPGLTTLHSKLFASVAAEEVCLEAARMVGSAGYVVASAMNRLLADARAVALMGPTNELCREIVAASWPR